MKNHIIFLFFLFLSRMYIQKESWESSEERDFYPEELPLLEEKNIPDLKKDVIESGEEEGTHEDHMSMMASQFKKISQNITKYQVEAKDCINEIPHIEFGTDKLDECTGENFLKLVLGIKFEIMKVLSKSEKKIRDIMLRLCYEKAGENNYYLESCDNLERDTIDLVWRGYDFVDVIDANKKKYLHIVGKMPVIHYKEIFDNLVQFSVEFFELLNEIDSHKEITLIGLKLFIDEKKNEILEESKTNPSLGGPKNLIHVIEIEQTEVQPEVDEDRKLKKVPANFIKVVRFNKK